MGLAARAAAAGAVVSVTQHARLTAALTTLHWSQATLAQELDVSAQTVRRWVSERYVMPEALLSWLERLAGVVRDTPAPRKEKGII